LIECKILAKVGQFSLSAELRLQGISCIAGRNGSGKTTVLRALAGLAAIDEGYVRVGSADVTKLPVERRGMVLVTPGSSFRHLDVDSHLTWGARLRRLNPGAEDIARVRTALGIDFGGPVRNLSQGMRQRVSLATALLSAPKAILVDEAFSNLHQRESFIAAYGSLAREAGIDLVFSSQDEADGRLSDCTYVLVEGTAVRVSPPK
jgi:molybdate/tungstate transport system ATP-binding protein